MNACKHAGVETVTRNGKLFVVHPSENGKEYFYPSSYGTKVCQAWDIDKEPSCADAMGTKNPDAKPWCSYRWCYVNQSECHLEDVTLSTGFLRGAPDDLHYSYGACGGPADAFNSADSHDMRLEMHFRMHDLRLEVHSEMRF